MEQNEQMTKALRAYCWAFSDVFFVGTEIRGVAREIAEENGWSDIVEAFSGHRTAVPAQPIPSTRAIEYHPSGNAMIWTILSYIAAFGLGALIGGWFVLWGTMN